MAVVNPPSAPSADPAPQPGSHLQDVVFCDPTLHLARPWRLRQPAAADESVIFLHVPKSGGTTVDFLLAAAAAWKQETYRRLAIGRLFAPPVWLTPGWTGAWGAAETRFASPAPRLLSGHFPFGLHARLPGPARYVTLIRDPVAREISSFNFHVQRGFLSATARLEALLEQRTLLDNPQTRLLAGPEAMDGPCTEAVFAAACAHLEQHFALVCPTEASAGFIAALLGYLGYPPVLHTHNQITRVRSLSAPSPELRASLAAYHAWDVRLHARAGAMWATWQATAGVEIPTAPLPPETLVVVADGDIRHQTRPVVRRADGQPVPDENPVGRD